MSIAGGIISLIVAIWINSMLAGAASNIAGDKGYSQRRWFHACFWLPGITYLLVAALPDMELRRQNEEMIKLQKQFLASINGNKYDPSDDVPNPITE